MGFVAATRLRLEHAFGRRLTGAFLVGAPIAALMALFLVTGLRGLNFGYHWDEGSQQLDPTRSMVANGILVPRLYNYPSMTKWLVLAPALPAAIQAGLQPNADGKSIQAAMVAAMTLVPPPQPGQDRSPAYMVTCRRLFLVLSSLALLATYAAALVLGRKPWEAFVAAAVLGLSWEYAYHARWVAADCVLTSLAALTILSLAAFRRRGHAAWLYAAAVAAGLCAGTKYQGVIMLLPVLAFSVLARPRSSCPHPWRAQIGRLAALSGIALLVYYLTTPATLVDPFLFWKELRDISEHYRTGNHGGYDVAGPAQHLWTVLLFFGVSYFSPYAWLTPVLLAASVAGAVAWVRRERRFAGVLVALPLLFLALFGSRYVVVIVRNYLFFVPVMALALARGVALAMARLPRPWARGALTGALVIVGAANAAWLVTASQSIRHHDPKADVRDAFAYVAEHPTTRFVLSPKVEASAREQHVPVPSNATVQPDAADSVVFFALAEGPGMWGWKSNDPFATQAVFGTQELNFSWYSTWEGADRVVVMSIKKARATGVPFVR
jgi:hypothetical protein